MNLSHSYLLSCTVTLQLEQVRRARGLVEGFILFTLISKSPPSKKQVWGISGIVDRGLCPFLSDFSSYNKRASVEKENSKCQNTRKAMLPTILPPTSFNNGTFISK